MRLGVLDVGMVCCNKSIRFETSLIALLVKIVKESSACIAGYLRTLLDANHEDMCKFKDKNDINYIRVSGLLAR